MTPDVSLVVTTYGGETAHTQHCLGRLREWKEARHEVIVVCHDETPLLRAFLELARTLGVIDRLVPAVSGHGHVRGVNLGFSQASAEVVFNVCIDMRIGPEIVDECARRLRAEERLGLIGWHYDWSTTFAGTSWRADGGLDFTLRKHDDSRVAGDLDPSHVENMRSAPWHTGRVFAAIGTRRILCCNGSFFGVRKALWNRLGGFDEARYPAHWADDFFTYAVLDQGLDVANLPVPHRCGRTPRSFEALTDLPWQGRHDPQRGRDHLDWKIGTPTPGLEDDETILLEVLDRGLASDARVAVVGSVPWRPTRGAPADVNDPPFDFVLAGPGSYEPRQKSWLQDGGVLVVFGGVDDPSMQRTTNLAIHRREPARAAFTRSRAGSDPEHPR